MPNEPIPVDEFESLLNTYWNSGNVTEPTHAKVNDGTQAERFDYVSNDLLLYISDSPTFDETAIGNWGYGNQRSRVIIEIYSSVNRQRLYDLMREIRRVTHDKQSDMTNYQLANFLSFNELTDMAYNVWIGRVIIELINDAFLLNVSD